MIVNPTQYSRMAGYIVGSEWVAQVSFNNAFAAFTTLTVKAAGGGTVRNVVYAWDVGLVTGANAYLGDFAILDGGAEVGRYRKNLAANSGDTFAYALSGASPYMIGSANSAVQVIAGVAGVAGLAITFSFRGYQIQQAP